MAGGANVHDCSVCLSSANVKSVPSLITRAKHVEFGRPRRDVDHAPQSAAPQIFLVAQSAQAGGRLVEKKNHRTTWGPRHRRGVSVRNAQKTSFRAIWTTGGKVGAQPLNRQNAGLQLDTAPGLNNVHSPERALFKL